MVTPSFFNSNSLCQDLLFLHTLKPHENISVLVVLPSLNYAVFIVQNFEKDRVYFNLFEEQAVSVKQLLEDFTNSVLLNGIN